MSSIRVKIKAARYKGPQKIVLEETDMPDMQPGCVLVDVKACGICGSDLHLYFGYWEPKEFAGGHEFVGVVKQVADDVTHVNPGDRVCVECFTHCRTCRYCRTGFYNLCLNRRFDTKQPGGFAEYTLADARATYRLPDGLPFDLAALIEPLAVSHRAFRQSGARESLFIIGAGTIGLMALAAAKYTGVENTVILAKYEHQANAARELGANHVLMADEQAIPARVKVLTGDLGAEAVVETVASDSAFELALDAARRGGTIVLVGGYSHKHKPTVKLGPIVSHELLVRGSCCYGFSGGDTDFASAIKILSSGALPFERLITHRFALDEIAQAFRTAGDKHTGSIKVLICQ